MPKCLFILSDFERGGIPRVTLNLLNQLDTALVEVEVFCGNHHGIFRKMFLECATCTLLPPSLFLQALMCHRSKESGIFLFFAIFLKVFRHACTKMFHWDCLNSLNKLLGRSLSKKRYDYVFATNEGLAADLALEVNAHKRYVWIHNDYAHDGSAKMPGLENRLAHFDGILCVAEHARKSLLHLFPKLAAKTRTLYNIVNSEEIIQKTQEKTQEECYPDMVDFFKIVSVGRFFDTQKKFSMIPRVCAEIKKRGFRFRWFLIGNGSPAETAIIKKAIDDCQPGDTFTMLGEMSNPYPYIKYADLFAVTSKYETYPTVINEARALGVPVLSTPFKGVDEVLDMDDGHIAAIEQFPSVIANLMTYERVRRNAKSFQEHNKRVLQKFMGIVSSLHTR